MLTTKDLIAKLQELDPGGTMRVVIPMDEIVSGAGDPTNIAEPEIALVGADNIGSLEWRGEGKADEQPAIVLRLGDWKW